MKIDRERESERAEKEEARNGEHKINSTKKNTQHKANQQIKTTDVATGTTALDVIFVIDEKISTASTKTRE